MKFSRKNNVFITLLLVTLTFNTYTMEPEDVKKVGWVALAGAVIVGGAVALNKFLSYIHSKPFDFTSQSPEMQNKIILFLTTNTTAESLKEAAQTINSLAQTNKELNEWINDPEFCLKIIKHLAKKFNCSDQEAAEKLQTQAAKERLKNQKELINLSYGRNPTERLKKLFGQNIDFTFTYYFKNSNIFHTPIIIIITQHQYALASNIIVAAFNQGVNLTNQYDPEGNTALILCINDTVQLDGHRYAYQQHADMVGWQPIYFNCRDTINYLLQYGADPELANSDGITPLQAAQKTGNQEIIDLIQNAIEKKHEKK